MTILDPNGRQVLLLSSRKTRPPSGYFPAFQMHEECLQVDTSNKWNQLSNLRVEFLAREFKHMHWQDSTSCPVESWRSSRQNNDNELEGTEEYRKHLQNAVGFDPDAKPATLPL